MKITIIGSGLVGTLMALYLVRRGYEVDIYESRPNPKDAPIDNGRSINLAMSCRGLTGISEIGLLEKVRKILVPMRGRAIHEEDGAVKYQPFGRDDEEYINAVQRNQLNLLLIEEAEKHPKIRQFFATAILDIDFTKKKFHIDNNGQKEEVDYTLLIGADGASSFVRSAMVKEGIIQCTRTYLPYGYKELSISRKNAQEFAPEKLHLWPRDSFLLLGNPNLDNSLTGSLFLPHEGKNSFAELDNELRVEQFFAHSFADAYPAMPDLIGEFFNHPTGNMSTINCSPWFYGDDCLLLGDAAHGIVPFFGQGMNCGFEDCRILDTLLDAYNDDWSKVMPAFYAERKPNTDAVSLMSMDNYHEIQTDIRDGNFNRRKEVEQLLMHRFPQRYVSKHVLVMFTNTPYAKAQAVGTVQLELLNTICTQTEDLQNIKWNEIDKLMEQYDKKLANLGI